MKSRILAFSAMALLSANVAHAGTIYDTINFGTFSGTDGPAGDATTVMGVSFYSPINSFTVTLDLTAGNAGDGGISSVYLVPDDNSGGSLGVAGNPIAAFVGGSTAGSQLLGTVSDSSLTAADNPISFNVENTSVSTNGEYWVALVAGTGSSVEWQYIGDAIGIGTAGQGYISNYLDGSTTGPVVTYANGPGYGPYELSVVPEPASVALLGAGLAGLGLLRRRKAA
jgi:hypothetical protein